MVWIHAVAEYAVGTYGDNLMNPTSPDKIRRLGRFLRLTEGQRVLDIGAGTCGPALMLAREFGCLVTAVEPYGDFIDEARRRVTDAGLTDRFELVQAKGDEVKIEPGRYDVAMCLGATWAWGGLAGTIEALVPGVRDRGHVVAGEPYVRRAEDAKPDDPHGLTLPQVIQAFEERSLAVTALIRSSEDDWDVYTSVETLGFLEWLEDHPDHADAPQVREWRRRQAARLAEPYVGWAIVAGRKTPVA